MERTSQDGGLLSVRPAGFLSGTERNRCEGDGFSERRGCLIRGYRKALRLYEDARCSKNQFDDDRYAGAFRSRFRGRESPEAIATNLKSLTMLRTTHSYGDYREGGSGGALAIGLEIGS